jgi:cysteine desulfurase/selenocysteine lyase
MLNSQTIKKDFPIFSARPDLVYLDTTATALKPQTVIDAVTDYYSRYSANVHRGIYTIAEEATAAYEAARKTVMDFIGAKDVREIIFTRGTTEGLNLVAYTLGKELIDEKSEVVVSIAEHHSNFVPWQTLAFENGAAFKVVELNKDGVVSLTTEEEVNAVITERTKIVALTYVSNVVGVINPLKKIISLIKKKNPQTIVVVDGAQAAPSVEINVTDLGADFFTFSGHKLMGPTGIGVLWGRYDLLSTMYPFQYGGEMIDDVSVTASTFAAPPQRFEAGTPPIAEAIGLAAAISYVQKIGKKEILAHERLLWDRLFNELKENKRIRLIGPASSVERVGIFSFSHERVHPHDLSDICSKDNVCVRAGHHCAMPLHKSMSLPASTRVSIYAYTTEKDIEKFLASLSKAEKLLG